MNSQAAFTLPALLCKGDTRKRFLEGDRESICVRTWGCL